MGTRVKITDAMMTTTEAARFLGISPFTLEKQRTRVTKARKEGRVYEGPFVPWVRLFNGRIMYRNKDLRIYGKHHVATLISKSKSSLLTHKEEPGEKAGPREE